MNRNMIFDKGPNIEMHFPQNTKYALNMFVLQSLDIYSYPHL